MENLSLENLNLFDIIIASLIVLLGIKGFLHGFVKELFSIIGLIGGVYFASRLSPVAAEFIDTNLIHLENTALLQLIGFLAILLIIWTIASIIGSLFSKSGASVSFFSRIFGFIMGLGKYFLIFALIVTALSNVTFVKDNFQKHIKDSTIYPYLQKSGTFLINMKDVNPIETKKDSETNTSKETNPKDTSTN